MGNKINKKNNEKFKKDKQYNQQKDKNREKKITKHSCKIIFLGDSSIGSKSTLINLLLFGNCEINNDNYNGLISYKKIKLENGKEMTLVLCDTAGQERFRSVSMNMGRGYDCFVLGYDITCLESFKSIQEYFYPALKEITNTDFIYLIGNKIDLYEYRKVEKEIAENYAEEKKIKFFEISCKTQSGIKEFYDDLINEIIKRYSF